MANTAGFGFYTDAAMTLVFRAHMALSPASKSLIIVSALSSGWERRLVPLIFADSRVGSSSKNTAIINQPDRESFFFCSGCSRFTSPATTRLDKVVATLPLSGIVRYYRHGILRSHQNPREQLYQRLSAHLSFSHRLFPKRTDDIVRVSIYKQTHSACRHIILPHHFVNFLAFQ